ncbi:hypothetical protein ONZ43_g869 [Nemania bipapillata]|uniref:Uncharacterized protein n=1 Tax=Nemania bipapillata TaxID=110536 RepID=A0ACC2J6N5_9PEZI|nr:hypothetical protein ONZ43_g869 [Nemania bipapillata]
MKITRAFRDLFVLASVDVVTSLSINVTAITASNGRSHFECWELSSAIYQSKEIGVNGTAASFLGDVTNITHDVDDLALRDGKNYAAGR